MKMIYNKDLKLSFLLITFLAKTASMKVSYYR